MRTLLVIVALVLGLAFHSRNHQPVTLDFYARTFDVPLSWAVVAALAAGAALGALVMVPSLVALRRALRRERRRADLLQAAPPAAPTNAVEGLPASSAHGH
ncbi:MAG: lipopolysaccharide assembly protein LapA domain-containing protein [Gammaproteobacteria bacterium]